VNVPPELEETGADVLLGSAENEFVTATDDEAQPVGSTSAKQAPADDRDWRSRAPGESLPPREQVCEGGEVGWGVAAFAGFPGELTAVADGRRQQALRHA